MRAAGKSMATEVLTVPWLLVMVFTTLAVWRYIWGLASWKFQFPRPLWP